MPKIRITEIDRTGIMQQASISNTVYVPIQVNTPEPSKIDEYKDIFPIDTSDPVNHRCTEPVLCRSTSQLEKTFGPLIDKRYSLDYRICRHLLSLGFDVLVQGWVNVALSGSTFNYTYAATNIRYKVKQHTGSVPKPAGGWPELAQEAYDAWLVDPKPFITDDGYPVLIDSLNNDGELPIQPNIEDAGSTQKVTGGPSPTEGTVKYAKIHSENVVEPTFDYSSSNPDMSNVDLSLEDITQGQSADGNVYLSGSHGPEYEYSYRTPISDDDAERIIERIVILTLKRVDYVGTISPEQDAEYIINGPGFIGEDASVLENTIGDKGLYDIRFLTAGTFANDESMLAISNCAVKRGDCVALVNVDELDEDWQYDVDKVRKAFQRLGGSTNAYCAGFTPWFYSTHPELLPADNRKGQPDYVETVVIPAAFGYLFAYGNSVKTNPEWYAVAGFERGIIPELADVCHTYSSADVEILQARGAEEVADLDDEDDNVGFAINPIAYIRPAGYILWGNRTMRINDASYKTIATSFLNVRNGVSAIKKVLYTAARKYTFEQNNELLWTNFQAYTRPLLDKMVAGNGLLGYKWIRLATTAKARLKAKLQIVPIEAVEDFDLEIELTNDLSVSE